MQTLRKFKYMYFHMLYRDEPSEDADFWLVSNASQEDSVLHIEGRSLFSAVR